MMISGYCYCYCCCYCCSGVANCVDYFETNRLTVDWCGDHTSFRRRLGELHVWWKISFCKWKQWTKTRKIMVYYYLIIFVYLINRTGQTVLWIITFCFARMYVLFLTGPWVLKPHLGDPFAEPCHRCNTFQILAIRITVYLKIGLQYLKLFLCKRRSHTFCFTFVVAIRITTIFKYL